MGKLGNVWKTMLAGSAGVAALAALNASIRRNAAEPDDSALGGDPSFYAWKHGRIFYKVAGANNPGPPLVFVHGVGAGASSFMWRKNFDALADDFRVYALDLLGFGFSDKPATAPYSADLYVELITELQLGKLEGAAERLGRIAKISFEQQFGAQPIVCLACTELPLAFREKKMLATFEYDGVLYLNASAVHINAAFDFAIE